MRVLPAAGARHPLPGRVVREVRGVGRVLEELAVAEAGAVEPGDGEVQVALPGEVAEEEGGGQQAWVRLAVVRVRYQGEEHVADQVQHDRKVGKPAEHDHEPVVASVAAGPGENLGLVVHERTGGCGVGGRRGHSAESAHTGPRRRATPKQVEREGGGAKRSSSSSSPAAAASCLSSS